MRGPVFGLVVVGLGLAANTASADQCAWVSRDVAERAKQKVLEQKSFLTYCAPCRGKDAIPSAVSLAKTVEVRTARNPKYSELVIDGHAVDLAYVYIFASTKQSGDRMFENLGHSASCPVQDVPLVVTVNKDGKLVP